MQDKSKRIKTEVQAGKKGKKTKKDDLSPRSGPPETPPQKNPVSKRQDKC